MYVERLIFAPSLLFNIYAPLDILCDKVLVIPISNDIIISMAQRVRQITIFTSMVIICPGQIFPRHILPLVILCCVRTEKHGRFLNDIF